LLFIYYSNDFASSSTQGVLKLWLATRLGLKKDFEPAFLQEIKVWECDVPCLGKDLELPLKVVKIIGVSHAIEIHLQAQTRIFRDLRTKSFDGTQRVVGHGVNGGDPHIQNQTAE
jgi:hypothetical protein